MGQTQSLQRRLVLLCLASALVACEDPPRPAVDPSIARPIAPKPPAPKPPEPQPEQAKRAPPPPAPPPPPLSKELSPCPDKWQAALPRVTVGEVSGNAVLIGLRTGEALLLAGDPLAQAVREHPEQVKAAFGESEVVTGARWLMDGPSAGLFAMSAPKTLIPPMHYSAERRTPDADEGTRPLRLLVGGTPALCGEARLQGQLFGSEGYVGPMEIETALELKQAAAVIDPAKNLLLGFMEPTFGKEPGTAEQVIARRGLGEGQPARTLGWLGPGLEPVAGTFGITVGRAGGRCNLDVAVDLLDLLGTVQSISLATAPGAARSHAAGHSLPPDEDKPIGPLVEARLPRSHEPAHLRASAPCDGFYELRVKTTREELVQTVPLRVPRRDFQHLSTRPLFPDPELSRYRPGRQRVDRGCPDLVPEPLDPGKVYLAHTPPGQSPVLTPIDALGQPGQALEIRDPVGVLPDGRLAYDRSGPGGIIRSTASIWAAWLGKEPAPSPGRNACRGMRVDEQLWSPCPDDAFVARVLLTAEGPVSECAHGPYRYSQGGAPLDTQGLELQRIGPDGAMLVSTKDGPAILGAGGKLASPSPRLEGELVASAALAHGFLVVMSLDSGAALYRLDEGSPPRRLGTYPALPGVPLHTRYGPIWVQRGSIVTPGGKLYVVTEQDRGTGRGGTVGKVWQLELGRPEPRLLYQQDTNAVVEVHLVGGPQVAPPHG